MLLSDSKCFNFSLTDLILKKKYTEFSPELYLGTIATHTLTKYKNKQISNHYDLSKKTKGSFHNNEISSRLKSHSQTMSLMNYKKLLDISRTIVLFLIIKKRTIILLYLLIS